jgi:hypothetical protein
MSSFSLQRNGDFQETYQENEPDFFIHVAEKSPGPNGQLGQHRSGPSLSRRRHLEMRNGH